MTRRQRGVSAARQLPEIAGGHYRTVHGERLSSIGLGTRLGAVDDATDARYQEVTVRAASLGVNVLDTSFAYRGTRSERALGKALCELLRDEPTERPFVCTKGGSIPSDGVSRELEQVLSSTEVVGGRHSIGPDFLEHVIERSREQLGIETIDLYYLENVETQLDEVGPEELDERLAIAFETLERAAELGRIRHFGISSEALTRSPRAENYVSLDRVVALARDVGGDEHRLGFVQAPYSLFRPQAMSDRNQMVGGESYSLIQAAEKLGLAFIAAGSLGRGRAVERVPAWLSGILKKSATSAQRAVQFIRSTPGVSTALVGMSRLEHAEEILDLARIPPLTMDEFEQLYPPEAAQSPWLF